LAVVAKRVPSPPAPKLFGFQPNPAMFAAKKLRGPVMVLREEISDIEEVEEEEEEEDDRMEVDIEDVEDVEDVPQHKSVPVLAWMPLEQDDPTAQYHHFVRRLEFRAGRKRSRHGSGSDIQEDEFEPVQTIVRRSFGLWHAGNPQSFASERRRIDPTADLDDNALRWIPRRNLTGEESPEGTPPPPTPKSKDLYRTPANPVARVSKLDLYQRPRSHSVGNLLLQRELEATARRAAAISVHQLKQPPLIKSRVQNSTYINQPRSYVKNPIRDGTLGYRQPGREEESWLKAPVYRVPNRMISPILRDGLWTQQRPKSMISLPLYDSDGEGVDLEIDEGGYDVEGELIIGISTELEHEEQVKADSDHSMESCEDNSPTKAVRRSSRRKVRISEINLPTYLKLDDEASRPPGSGGIMALGSGLLGQLEREKVRPRFLPTFSTANLRPLFLPSRSIG